MNLRIRAVKVCVHHQHFEIHFFDVLRRRSKQHQLTKTVMKKLSIPVTNHFIVYRARRSSIACATSLAFLLALGACSKQDEKTAGQRLDSAIEKTNEAAAQAKAKFEESAPNAKAKTEEALVSAGVALKNATQTAESAVRAAAGKAGNRMDDLEVNKAIKLGLENDPTLKTQAIKVETKEGVVTLSGVVPNEAIRTKAGALAKAVQGVQSVDNQLVLKAG